MLEETPTKVLSLLGVALTSLAFLFVVSATDASMSGTLAHVPDPFAPEQVVAVIDTAASGYSQFLAINLFTPAQQDFAFAADNISWIGNNAKDGALAMLGISQQAPAATAIAQGRVAGQVAGAQTTRSSGSQHGSGILDSLYSLLR